MFLTVTANAALDRILFIDRFAPGLTMRSRKAVDAVGGKGFDVSVALRGLGQETLAAGFIAGHVGTALEKLMHAYGIFTDLVEVEGETRIAHVIVETKQHRHSHVTTPGYEVSPGAYQALLNCCERHLSQAKWVIAGGSLPVGVPQDFYLTLTRMAHACGLPVLIDTSGEPVHLVLDSRPDILKMNREEFMTTFVTGRCSLDDLVEKAAKLSRGLEMKALVVTCGVDGVLAFTAAGSLWARGPKLDAVNAAGAGDALSAGLVWRLSRGDCWDEALRWAMAAGAASVMSQATAECDLRSVEDLYARVVVQALA
jgi:1-phosphofructokinase family hexose kinase